MAKVLWVGAAALALGLTSIALSVPHADGLAVSSLSPPDSSAPVIQQSGGPLPSIDLLKSEYLRCEGISSKRRLSMHGLAFCRAVSDQLVKREFGGDPDLLLAWRRGERQASAARHER